MMRKPYSAPNYDDPVEWPTPPDYHHAPLQAGHHTIPVMVNAAIVTFTVEAGPRGQTITVIVRSGGA